MKIVLCCGVGGTGKTSVVEEVIKNESIDFIHFPSVTREYYALNGVLSEKESKEMGREEQIEFQTGLMNFYLHKIREVVIKTEHEYGADNKKVIIGDRSIIDHYCYILKMQPLGSAEYAKVRGIYNVCKDFYSKHTTTLVYFPFPVKWSTSDGFRDVDNKFNNSLNTAIVEELSWFKGNVLALSNTTSIHGRSNTVLHLLT